MMNVLFQENLKEEENGSNISSGREFLMQNVSIPVPYYVGYKFYAPRVYASHSKEYITNNGYVYSREVVEYIPLIKSKIITGIEISVSMFEEVSYTFLVKDYDTLKTRLQLPTHYKSGCVNCFHDFQFTEKEMAEEFITEWMKNNPNKEYFGGKHDG